MEQGLYLTAVRDPADMLTHHLLDCLAAVLPLRRELAAIAYRRDGEGDGEGDAAGGINLYMENTLSRPLAAAPLFRLLDVGSGAGLPGIVIAICCPDVAVDCVDTVAKKAAFISQVALGLKLSNLRGIHARVESLAERYDVVSSRAFASLADFTAWSRGALKEGGVWLAMKGQHPQTEIDALTLGNTALTPSVKVFHVEQLKVPGLAAERCLVWMRLAAPIP